MVQILIQRLLGHVTPDYAHVPVAVNAAGEKLSKQTQAPPVVSDLGAQVLVRALRFLGQNIPDELARSDCAEVWKWARENWSLAKVPRQRSLFTAND